MSIKHETVCIKRTGLEFVHSEGGDFAAKVTYLKYEPGKLYDHREGIVSELLIPRFGWWG